MSDTAAAPHGMGDNNPPGPTDVFGPRLDRLLMDLTRLLALPITEEVAGQLRDVVARCIALDKELTEAKAKDKQPHLDANTAIEAAYRPLTADTARIKSDARASIDGFLLAEDARRKREAKAAADAAAAAALAAEQAKAQAEEDGGNPGAADAADDALHEAAMTEHAAVHAERRAAAGPRVGSAAGLGRSTSLRTYYSAVVNDRAVAAQHFASDPGVFLAVQKAADAVARATRGSQPIPGCDIKAERRSA